MKYSAKSLRMRSDCGSLCMVLGTFSTNFVRDAASCLALVPDSEIIEAALKILAKRMSRGSLLASPRAARDYLALRFGQVEQEVFAAIYLTKRHHVIACEELFRGTLDGESVHPREVVKEALARNAAALIFCHCHPSGQSSPSQADELITMRLNRRSNWLTSGLSITSSSGRPLRHSPKLAFCEVCSRRAVKAVCRDVGASIAVQGCERCSPVRKHSWVPSRPKRDSRGRRLWGA
jgi:DNA repair protein RadC